MTDVPDGREDSPDAPAPAPDSRQDGPPDARHQAPSRPWRHVWSWLTLLITAVLLTVLLLQLDDWSLLAAADPLWLALAVAISLLLNALAAPFKFSVVAAWFGLRARFVDIWRLWVGLQPIANFMPFDSGTLLFAIGLGRQPGLDFRQSFTAAIYDKYVSLVGAFAMVAVGQIFVPRIHALSSLWLAVGAVGAVLIYLFDGWLLRLVPLRGPLRHLSVLLARPARPGLRLLALLLAMAIQGADMLCLYLASRALGVALDPLLVLGVYPVVRLLTLIPVTVNGFGAREALTVVFFSSLLGNDEATASSILVDLVGYVVPALFGLLFLRAAVAMLGGSWSKSPEPGGSDRAAPG